MKGRQHDAHVRARRAILRRVIARARDWSMRWASAREANREKIAAAKLAKYCRNRWPSFWTQRTVGRYPEQHAVPGKGIPEGVIHSIMCEQVPETVCPVFK